GEGAQPAQVATAPGENCGSTCGGRAHSQSRAADARGRSRAAGARGGIAQRGGGGVLGAPMRRRVRRSIEAPDSSAPNRSGEGAPASPHPSLGSCSSPAGRPAVRDGAARERGRRRSAYEAPHGSVAPGPVSSGAESKRRRCPRSRARQSRVTLLALRRRAARLGLRPAAGCDAVEGLLPLAPLAELARRPAVLAHVLVRAL